jgi:chorismate mutase
MTCRIDAGGVRNEGGGIIIAVLVTVTCAVCAVFPSAAVTGVTTVQVVLAVGAIAQASPTA